MLHLLLEELFLSRFLLWALLAPPQLLALTCPANMSLKLSILSLFFFLTLFTVYNSYFDD